jgi:hypothetical protein
MEKEKRQWRRQPVFRKAKQPQNKGGYLNKS